MSDTSGVHFTRAASGRETVPHPVVERNRNLPATVSDGGPVILLRR